MSAQPLRKALSPQFSNDFIFVAQNGIIFMDLTVETGKSYRYMVRSAHVFWKYLGEISIFVLFVASETLRLSNHLPRHLFTMLFCSLTPQTMLDTIKVIG